MSDTDHPKQSLVALASAVSQRVQIESIVLASTTASRNLDADVPDEIKLSPKFQVNVARDPELSKTRVIVTFKMSGYAPGSDSQTEEKGIFYLEADFALTYKISSSEGLDDQHFGAFGKMNGVYNAWPYWREYAQTTLARMGFPPVTVPVLTSGALERIYIEQPDDHPEVEQGTESQ